MHAMCSRLLLPTFGTRYTWTSCSVQEHRGKKEGHKVFFLVSCHFVGNEACKLTNQTFASGGLSTTTDQIKIRSRNLEG